MRPLRFHEGLGINFQYLFLAWLWLGLGRGGGRGGWGGWLGVGGWGVQTFNAPVRTLLTLVAPTDEFASQNYAPAAGSPFQLPVLAQFIKLLAKLLTTHMI